MIYAAIFLVALIRVFARAYQQISVIRYKWIRIIPVSYAMSAADNFQWAATGYFAARQEWLMIVIVWLVQGTAGWMGAHLAMYVQKRFP